MTTPSSSTPSDRVRAAASGAVEQAGLVVEDVEVAGTGTRKVVRLTVDLPDGPGGVTSDQIGDVSRAVSAAMDEHDAVDGTYTLEVSTPGTDRPLTEPRHFRRAVGRLLDLTTADGRRTARLTGVEGDTLQLTDEQGTHEVPLADVTRARVEVELTRP
ncbi:ribosome maturation factor RimP [Georgenia sp. Z1344]|uniref:ribosome maturation factor RimP n=1 Tax=Georgenia sp. Z1344 TaxID=3416706 RepID=UPI003CE95122